MNGPFSMLAAIALVPAMTGVPPAEAKASRTIVIALCAGGTMTIPIDGNAPARATMPCCAKGCRSRRKNRSATPV
ncbi:hypothetical protein [Croceicoccus naphthovorans]|uniref:Uncharacterized protein n=1 Tax=Croceicoccus naphthovorans TaxID=1348774 RepID=A0A0G3XDB6_9SPHN|nr:hypothetical protein [Croceicoccus naphthovorans]AKM09520.1 hypothetical protein AB433_05255 [Croceicoccus naphthovorans]MBB3989734.1 hypothetical protein [Croceicoccus naphthovorans]